MSRKSVFGMGGDLSVADLLTWLKSRPITPREARDHLGIVCLDFAVQVLKGRGHLVRCVVRGPVGGPRIATYYLLGARPGPLE